jgi:hypothetical protein
MVSTSVIFESKTSIVTYLDSGHMLHTDRAYHNLPSGQWEPVRK